MLYEPPGVRGKRGIDFRLAHGRSREALERARVAVIAKRRAGIVEPALAEKRRRRRPRGAVAVEPVGARLRAEGEREPDRAAA